MKTITMHVCGIDISAKSFDVCFKQKIDSGRIVIKGSKSFPNNVKGFEQYLSWVRKRTKQCPVLHLMEATGIYHENLCYFLYEAEEQLSVQLAQKVKYYIKSLNINTKTDKADAAAIAEMGFTRQFEPWQPISKEFRNIRDLSRTLVRLKQAVTTSKSQLHAMDNAYITFAESKEILIELIRKQEELIDRCEKEILTLVKRDPDLELRIKRITKIKGIGELTVIKLLAETDGFRNTKSIRSLVSYAGLDVVHNQSGERFGKTRISKKGNAYIRAALYMPAMAACQHDPKSIKTYEKLSERLPKKRQAIVAVMRKLLIMIYTLWKNGEEYCPDHEWQKKDGHKSPSQDSKITS